MSCKRKLMRMFFGVGIFVFALGLGGSAAAQTWLELFPAGGPSGPILGYPGGAGYDAANNRLIVYFGTNPTVGDPPSEVWVLSNANGLGGQPVWTQLFPLGSPPFHHGHAGVVYDELTNRLIVYGGCFQFCSPAVANVHVLSNANGLGGPPVWTQSSVTNPQPRVDHSAVLDALSNTLIAFGGHFAFYGTDQNDTRLLSNANGLVSPSTWTSLATSGTPPGIRDDHSAIYDVTSNRMTIFAGENLITTCCPYVESNYNDVWVLSNANGQGGTPTWTQLSPLGSLPDPRFSHSAVYDSAKTRMIVFGGLRWNQAAQNYTTLGDLWQLSNANGLGGTSTWTQLTPSGTPPSPNYLHLAAFDTANQRMIIFGGADQSNTVHRRVWVLVFNQAPVAMCQNVTVSAGPNCTANASIDNGSFDPDGDTITLTQSPPGPYPLGNTLVTLTVTDSKGASSQCTATVTVVDNTPPAITGGSASPSVLWPPNHQMVSVTVNYSVTDNCDPSSALTCTLSVSSNEPVDGTGDGDAAPDWEVVDAHHVRLRAERAGSGNGRVYTITITCTDSGGNSSVKTVTVSVPKNQS